MDEQEIRKSERMKIAGYLREVALNTLYDRTSDAIDGYTAAVVLDLAETLEQT